MVEFGDQETQIQPALWGRTSSGWSRDPLRNHGGQPERASQIDGDHGMIGRNFHHIYAICNHKCTFQTHCLSKFSLSIRTHGVWTRSSSEGICDFRFSSEHFEKITVLGYQSTMKPTHAISRKTFADQTNRTIFSGGSHVKSNTHSILVENYLKVWLNHTVAPPGEEDQCSKWSANKSKSTSGAPSTARGQKPPSWTRYGS